MPSTPPPSRPPGVAAATHSEPDLLAVQFTDLADGATEAMRTLFRARGFRPVEQGEAEYDAETDAETDELDLRPANGCLLTRLDLLDAELLVSIGASGASRIPLTGLDPAWLERVVATGHAAVLLVDAAVRDGSVTREDLRRDAVAGVVLAALVPTADGSAG